MTETLRLGTTDRRLDEAAIQQGVEKDCPMRPGLTVTVLPAASYNPRFRRALQNDALRTFRGNGEKLTEEEAEERAASAFLDRQYDPEFVVEALVADMDGIRNGNGNPVQYTKERGLAILSATENADVLNWIVGVAQQQGDFYTNSVEEDAGN